MLLSKKLADWLAAHHPPLKKRTVLDVLFYDREKISTTAIRAKASLFLTASCPALNEVLGVFARSPEGVDFASLDGAPDALVSC